MNGKKLEREEAEDLVVVGKIRGTEERGGEGENMVDNLIEKHFGGRSEVRERGWGLSLSVMAFDQTSAIKGAKSVTFPLQLI